MSYKENRKMKVYEASDRNYRPVTQIRLQGKWLEDLGFEIGEVLSVECRGGEIIFTLRNECIVE